MLRDESRECLIVHEGRKGRDVCKGCVWGEDMTWSVSMRRSCKWDGK